VRLTVRVVLLLGMALPGLARADDATPPDTRSACQQVTPPDAPYACLEIIPPGASVWVTFDGEPRGLSPMGIPDLEPGPHTLRLDRQGDAPVMYRFNLEGGEVRRFDAPLVREPPIVPPGLRAPYPIAVMVENHSDARPQVGLDRADVVYEALAEGGISRFLALYMTQEAEAIGPVRSTRHYFVYTAAEYNAALVFVGASPFGYAALTATGIRTVNESRSDPGIWRSARRYAPHDAFTGTLEARAAADRQGPGGPGSWGPLVFKNPIFPASGEPATSIKIRYPPLGWYDVSYEYDSDTNQYLRVMDGYRHRDSFTGLQLAASNVIVQIVPDDVIDREGRLDLAQTGEGPAYFFVDGVEIDGTWTKADYGSQTFFWDTAGNLVRLNTGGTTWIQLVPPEGRLAYSAT
jgi:Protein of unknown function (DUF3048) N-terminal domain/Protein of unknown function (DUF3048) C-terminal domain